MRITRNRFGTPAIWSDPDPDGGGSGTAGEKQLTFTQEQLNTLFAERSKSARAAAMAEALDAAGVKSLDELKQFVDNGKTALQVKADLEKKLATAEAEKTELAAQNTRRWMDQAIRAEAEKAGFLPEALDDVLAAVDRSGITQEGESFKGVDAAVKALAGTKKHWLKASQQKQGTPPPDSKRPLQDQNKPPAKRPLTF